MTLTLLDWAVIAGYLLLMLVLGIYFRRRSSRNTEEYFVSGRQVAWWLAGTSMVATTFAADTPLVVTGLVYTQGIAGNWLWWSFLPSGMMTCFCSRGCGGARACSPTCNSRRCATRESPPRFCAGFAPFISAC